VLIIGGATSDNLTTGTFSFEGLTGKFVGVKGSSTWRDTANDAEYYHTCFEANYATIMLEAPAYASAIWA
jgi:hypothetical protein